MYFQIIHPVQALQPYISRYVYVRAEGSTDIMTPPADDPRFVNGKHVQTLLPNYGSFVFMRNVVADVNGTPSTGLTLLGANQIAISLTTISGWFEGMLLDFEPGGMHALLGIDLQQLSGKVLTAETYNDEGLLQLDRLFKSTPQAENISTLLDAFFLGHLPQKEDVNYSRLRKVIAACDAVKGNISLGLDIRSRQMVDIYSAKLDFQTKFWQTGMIECGVKYGLSSTNNSMTTDSTINDILRSQTISNFIYDEHVAAAYISVGKQFGEHWSVKLGLRGEYTYSKGLWRQAQTDSLTSKSYFDPFPTAYVGYTSKPLGKLGQPIAVSASYTRRIKRPNYWMLNPFKTYVDAYSYQEGNTTLKPEFNNDVELHFSWTQYLNMTFNFAHTQDMFSSKMTIMPSGVGRSQWINFGTCTTHGANLSLTELPLVPKYQNENGEIVNRKSSNRNLVGAWLALTVNAGWLHFINKSYEKQADGKPVYENRSHYGYAGGTLSAYLPKDWTMTFDGNWSSPMATGYNRQGSTYFLSFGIRKMYMAKGLIFNLNIQDLARSLSFHEEDLGQAPGYNSWYKNTVRQQRVMLSVTWMFGQYQQHKNRKVGDLDELNRLGGGGGVSTGN